ncbi:MAG TPA: type II toxin-antitoxin system VapC family toxin [Terriglobia bacterium]|nr:type II toxin-antitoxin system VapC family toxin [Terriglobia bacterium]
MDASVTLCWCFEDQVTAYSEALLDRMAAGDEASVPFVWPLELASALVRAERKKTLKVAQVTGFVDELSAWPIEVDTAGVDRTFQETLNLARLQNLSAYDAAYLELAIRKGLPLATLDEELRKAARAVGVKIKAAK